MSDIDLDQIIACPNCFQESGWWREAGRPKDWKECVVCETRGYLIIDSAKTLALPRKPNPWI